MTTKTRKRELTKKVYVVAAHEKIVGEIPSSLKLGEIVEPADLSFAERLQRTELN